MAASNSYFIIQLTYHLFSQLTTWPKNCQKLLQSPLSNIQMSNQKYIWVHLKPPNLEIIIDMKYQKTPVNPPWLKVNLK